MKIRKHINKVIKTTNALLGTRIFFYLFIVISTLALLYSSITALDPDLGWHLSMGNLIMTKGIPITDPFSYTMPTYPFVDHEWLTNVLLAKLYPIIQKPGLAVIYILFALGSIIISLSNPLSREKLKKYETARYLFLMTFGLVGISTYFGIRPQVESWLLFAILLRIVLDQEAWNKYWLLVPLLIVVWVNLHGSFAAGVIISLFIILVRSFRKKRIIYKDLIAMVLIIAASFVSPYLWRSWWEVWMQISDTSLRWTINEWSPVIFNYSFSFVILLAATIFLFWRYRKKFYLEELGLYILLLIQGLSSTRHIPFWIIALLPMLNLSLGFLIEDIRKIHEGERRFKLFSRYLIVGISVIFIVEIWSNVVGAKSLSEDRYYPVKAVEFLRNQDIEGNIFSNYDWGGYLIWKYPEKKVFIDGRMPSWRTNTTTQYESSNAMKDYITIADQGEYKENFAKFNINYVLIPAAGTNDTKPKLIKNLQKYFVSHDQWTVLNNKLKSDNWLVIYQDSKTVLYQRP